MVTAERRFAEIAPEVVELNAALDAVGALAVIEQGQCRFLSRKKHKLTGYQDLRATLVKEVNADTAVLDGELVVVDHLGRSVFADMMQRRHPARYFA